jgi:predicted Zn finger-like uncharacterized protein
MIVQCPDCTTRYELDARRVPAGRIRVRCARCRYVFPIEAQAGAAGNSPPAPQSRSKPVTPAAADPGIVQDAWASGAARPAADPVAVEHLETVATADNHATVDAEPMMGMESTRIQIEDAPEAAPEMGLDLEIERPTLGRDAETGAQPESPATATMTDAPQPVESDADTASPADQKARRLARALVSDILVYNREKRDTALANGTLVRALGQEIKKSWELYKERVTPEVATSTNYFKEALNDILSEGQQIF